MSGRDKTMSQGPKSSPPKGGKNKGKKGKKKTTMVSTPLTIVSRQEQVSKQKRTVRAADGLLVDNFISAGEDQMVSYSNSTGVSLQARQLITDEEYSNHTYETNDDRLHSIAWALPAAYGSGSATMKVDERGILGQFKSAVLTFTNRSVAPVTLRGTIPKATIGHQENVSFRTKPVKTTMKPGSSIQVPVTFKNTLNDVPHTNTFAMDNVGDVRYARLFDFVLTYPNINQQSNAAFDSTSKMVDIKVNVTYTASHTYNESQVTQISIDPFIVLNLQNYENMFLIDPPAMGPFALQSLKNLQGDTANLVVKSVTQTTGGANYVTIVSDDGAGDKMTPAFVFGQNIGDRLILPVPVVVNNVNYAIFTLTDMTLTGLTGPVWLLDATNNFSGSALTTSATISTRFRSPLAVGYYGSVTGSAAKTRSKRETGGTLEDSFGGFGDKSNHRQPRKRSLIAIISFLGAAIKILTVIREYKGAGRRK